MATHFVDGRVELAIVLYDEIGPNQWIGKLGEGVEHGPTGHVVRLVASSFLEMGNRHMRNDRNFHQADTAEEVLGHSEERLPQLGSVERFLDDHPRLVPGQIDEVAEGAFVDATSEIVGERDALLHPSRKFRIHRTDCSLVIIDRMDRDVEAS